MLARLHARSVDEGECRVWIGARGDNGYGITRGGLTGRRCRLYTHRAMWAAVHGELPSNLIVRHSCDNRPCLRVEHLLTGTTADNNADTVNRWTGLVRYGGWTGERGEAHRSHRLTEESVRELRALRASGWTYPALAEHYDISKQSAWLAATGRSWSHVR